MGIEVETLPQAVDIATNPQQEYAHKVIDRVDRLLVDGPDITAEVDGVYYSISRTEDRETGKISRNLTKTYIDDASGVNIYQYYVSDSGILCIYQRYLNRDNGESNDIRQEEVHVKRVKEHVAEPIEEILERVRLFVCGKKLVAYLNSGRVPEAGPLDKISSLSPS